MDEGCSKKRNRAAAQTIYKMINYVMVDHMGFAGGRLSCVACRYDCPHFTTDYILPEHD